MRRRGRGRARWRLDLLDVRFLGGSVRFSNPGRPVVTEPQCRQQMQVGSVRSPVDRRDPHQDVFGGALCVLHEHVEIAVLMEHAGVEQLVLHLVTAAPAVRLQQVGVRIGGLRVLVEVFHVRVRRRAIEVEVVLLHVLAMVAFVVGQPEEPLFENRILAVPESQAEAKMLLVIGNAGDAVFAPPVGARAGMVVREEVPGVAVLAVILADGAPLPFTEVWAPLFPGSLELARLVQSDLFCGHGGYLSLCSLGWFEDSMQAEHHGSCGVVTETREQSAASLRLSGVGPGRWRFEGERAASFSSAASTTARCGSRTTRSRDRSWSCGTAP